MPLEIITAWAPRFDLATLAAPLIVRDEYLPLYQLQLRSCQRLGYRHRVVSDQPMPGFEVIPAELPNKFSRAIVAAQVAAIEAWSGADPLLLVDGDVLIGRDLAPAFDNFDVGITTRNLHESPVNNGVMYVNAGAKAAARAFFACVAEHVADHWGGDQEAVARAAAPVPMRKRPLEQLVVRKTRLFGEVPVRLAFLPMNPYNATPGVNCVAGKSRPYAIHFKGSTKPQMAPYARDYLGLA